MAARLSSTMIAEPRFSVGIEEEYLLVDPQTRTLAEAPPGAMWEAFEARIPGLAKPEFLKSQIEVATGVCDTVGEAGRELAGLRRTVVEIAAGHGLAPIAASTHPFSEWQGLQHTNAERYNTLDRDLQAVARRLVICGMHVHVGIEDEDLRLDLMNQAVYFLPHLLALSTSSPFWRGQDTGLKSYRLSVFDELPRTGLPEVFESMGEYRRHVDVLERAGVIKDASMLWWDVRLSNAFPTVEMRITDVCTRLHDAVTIAALFVSILRMLYRLRQGNQRWRRYQPMLIKENRWRAQRYGLDEGLIDFGKGRIIPCADLIEELIAMLAGDAEALGCAPELLLAREIVTNGTSAHRQIRAHQQALQQGAGPQQALEAVVDFLINETRAGLGGG